MPMLTQNHFSIGSFSIPWGHDQYSESRFKQQPSATEKSRTLKLWNKSVHVNQQSLSILARNKISYKKKMASHQDHFLLPRSICKSLRKRKGKKKKKTTKWKQNKTGDLLKNLLQGQLSMECILVFRLPTHAEHQKLGWSLSPILQAQTTGSHRGCPE